MSEPSTRSAVAPLGQRLLLVLALVGVAFLVIVVPVLIRRHHRGSCKQQYQEYREDWWSGQPLAVNNVGDRFGVAYGTPLSSSEWAQALWDNGGTWVDPAWVGESEERRERPVFIHVECRDIFRPS
jgi:hypothetical protein